MTSIKDNDLVSNPATPSTSMKDKSDHTIRGDTEELSASELQALVKESIARNKRTIKETKSKVRKNKNKRPSKENRRSRNKSKSDSKEDGGSRHKSKSDSMENRGSSNKT